jgi:protein-tyrosine phosphatase
LKNPPQQIDCINIQGVSGLIGITSCPGMQDDFHFIRGSERLIDDLNVIRNWGAHIVVTLLETSEIHALGVSELGKNVLALDMVWLHLPVRNMGLPDELVGEKWRSAVLCLCNLVRHGQRVAVHCKEGIGRAGLLAASMVMGLGVPAAEAIRMVRQARSGSLPLYAHEKYCHDLDFNKVREPASGLHNLHAFP